MPEPIIAFNKVYKIYDTAKALDDLSFEVEKGQFFCLVGPSGCGKSTVLKIIAGLDKESSGQVVKPADVSMVFQNAALLPWLTVFDNVAFGLTGKRDARFIKTETLKYIEMTGLKDFEYKFPHELSGGQRQRVGIARALAVDPDVLLLDEPFSALDTATTEELHKDLLKIWEATRKTIVMVSHSIEEAVTLADKIMLMKTGRCEEIFTITIPRPRREQEALFMQDVQTIRKKFFV
jgi:NitT/TauT family transport system ATP-binding protein